MSPSVEPFNEVKYKALMDGLEVSELNLSQLERTKRIDSEFYKKENIAVDSILSLWDKKSIAECFYVSDGNHMGITDSFCENGIPYYRGQDIYHLFIENAEPLTIDQRTFDKPQMRRSHLEKGDVLMSIVGAIVGNSAIVTSSEPATCSCKLSIMRSKNHDILPELLLVYIKTKYGQVQIQKFKRGAAQTGLLLEDFDQLMIPVFGKDFQEKVRQTVKAIYGCTQQAVEAYNVAQNKLNGAIALNETCQNHTAPSIKTLSESFEMTGRLDAEYYLPYYQRCQIALCTNENVGSLCRIHDESFVPKEDEDYRYIELSNVGAVGEISGVNIMTGAELPSRARRRVKKGQVVVSSIEGSLQSCALITDDFDECLCSTGFYILDSEQINPETLLVLFKSKVIQSLMKQRCSGTILTGITKEELLSMPLPKIEDDLQKEIAENIQHSFKLRTQSKQLLEDAKRAVEMAIEQGEDIALKWLESKMMPEEV